MPRRHVGVDTQNLLAEVYAAVDRIDQVFEPSLKRHPAAGETAAIGFALVLGSVLRTALLRGYRRELKMIAFGVLHARRDDHQEARDPVAPGLDVTHMLGNVAGRAGDNVARELQHQWVESSVEVMLERRQGVLQVFRGKQAMGP